MKWRNKNAGKSPSDPDYLENYNAEEDFEAFCSATEDREQLKKEIHGNH